MAETTQALVPVVSSSAAKQRSDSSSSDQFCTAPPVSGGPQAVDNHNGSMLVPFSFAHTQGIIRTVSLIWDVAYMQNRSHAVMAQRTEAKDSKDDFPTPPWATRALLEHVLPRYGDIRKLTCLEPACGAGHMDKVLTEYFAQTHASDAFDYGYDKVRDFLTAPYEARSFDWVITNPPFRSAEEFVAKARGIANVGVAILARTVFIESVGRYERLFAPHPPAVFAQFVERVPMVKGRLDKHASTATGYAWFVWTTDRVDGTELVWIPPCRKTLEFANDYATPQSRLTGRQPDLFELDVGTGRIEATG